MSGIDNARSLLRLAGRDARALQAMLDPALVVDEIFGFHVQQAVEKGLKAWLTVLDVTFPLTHDLFRLVDLLESAGVAGEPLLPLARFTVFAVQARYEEGFLTDEPPLDRQAIIAELAQFLILVEQRIGN